MITFHKMDHMESRACVQLLLCNISERALTFSLKCNTGKYLMVRQNVDRSLSKVKL